MQHVSSMSLSYSVVKQLDKQKESNPNRQRWCETQGGGRWSSAVTKGTKTTLQTGRAPPDLFSLFYVLRRTFRSSIFFRSCILCCVECPFCRRKTSLAHTQTHMFHETRPCKLSGIRKAAKLWPLNIGSMWLTVKLKPNPNISADFKPPLFQWGHLVHYMTTAQTIHTVL